MTKAERDVRICEMYQQGATMETIRQETGLSRQRVQQILKQHNLARPRGRLPESDRDEFLGINLSKAVKDAVRQEAARRGVSMSELSSDALRDMLMCCGYPVEANQL